MVANQWVCIDIDFDLLVCLGLGGGQDFLPILHAAFDEYGQGCRAHHQSRLMVTSSSQAR